MGLPMNARRRGTSAVVLAAALATVCGCTAPPDDAHLHAQAAVEHYLEAVAAGDLALATELTDPRALEVPHEVRNPRVDVTAALEAVTEPIEEPWVTFLGEDTVYFHSGGEITESTTALTFQVTYRVGPGTGVEEVAVEQVGEDPADPAGWMVVDGLLTEGPVYIDDANLPAITLSGVELTDAGEYTPVWGYPGVYLLEAAELPEGYTAEPVTVYLGAEVAPPWNDSLPMLEAVPAAEG